MYVLEIFTLTLILTYCIVSILIFDLQKKMVICILQIQFIQQEQQSLHFTTNKFYILLQFSLTKILKFTVKKTHLM